MKLPQRDVREAHLVEWMDLPDCDPQKLERTFRAFEVVNRWIGRWGTLARQYVLPLLWEHARQGRTEPFRILDVGAGGGDVLRRLQGFVRDVPIPVALVGVDPDPRAMSLANILSDGVDPPIRWLECRAEDLLRQGERFHLVISNHVLHHLNDSEVPPFLKTLEDLALERVLVTDIRRSRLGYIGFAAASRVLFPGTFISVDGLLSIRRSFRPSELLPLVPEGWSVGTLAPYRLVLLRDVCVGNTRTLPSDS
jgi:2-polyprenyl-3-methyl-5-hydroxy-6-metoxy-1,4-benzoquinol methylase